MFKLLTLTLYFIIVSYFLIYADDNIEIDSITADKNVLVSGDSIHITEVKKYYGITPQEYSTLLLELEITKYVLNSLLEKIGTKLGSYENLYKYLKNISEENNNSTESKVNLNFYTNRIENQEFIFTSKPWPFKVDKFGEDINNLNEKLIKKRIVPKNRFTCKYATIANKYILIHFFIVNHSKVTLYFDTLNIEILNRYKISENMFWNVWMPEMEKHEFEMVINDHKNVFEDSSKLIRFDPNIPEHFSLKILGDESCDQKIYQIDLLAKFHDTYGNTYQIKSDKIYFIGFISSNSF